MNLKKLTYRTIGGAMLLFPMLIACTESDEPMPEQEKMSIRWSVKSASIDKGRSLIEGNTALQDSCTSYKGKQSIGIWGSYDIDQSGQTFTRKEFEATPLTYGVKNENTNPHNDWNYPGKNKYWEPGGRYTFRACYPQELMEDKMTEITPNIIQGSLNTAEVQRDIMVATAYVNTLTTDLSKPVPLDMMHVFSALKFKVKAANDYTAGDDAVTSCWLQNQSTDTDLFTTSGYLVFSGAWGAVTLRWNEYDASDAPMYRWEHSGISFQTENTLYTNNNNATGKEYATNDGWLLVIPQEVKANSLHFCYTLRNAGTKEFSVPIPAITYEAGKRYTYMLEISGASAKVTLSIADWNMLDSSHDINI